MPGIPITFEPKMHAEAKARGTIQHPTGVRAAIMGVLGFRV